MEGRWEGSVLCVEEHLIVHGTGKTYSSSLALRLSCLSCTEQRLRLGLHAPQQVRVASATASPWPAGSGRGVGLRWDGAMGLQAAVGLERRVSHCTVYLEPSGDANIWILDLYEFSVDNEFIFSVDYDFIV
jgi:hypothetical protein